MIFNFLILFSTFFINSIIFFLHLLEGSEKFCPSWKKYCMSCEISIVEKFTNQIISDRTQRFLIFGKSGRLYIDFNGPWIVR